MRKVVTSIRSPRKCHVIDRQDNPHNTYTGEPDEASKEMSELKKDIKVLKQKVRGVKRSLLWEVFDKNYKTRNYYKMEYFWLNFNFGGSMAKEMFSSQIKNATAGSMHAHRYSDETKSFVLTLHYYSLQAYEFTCKILAPPHVTGIRAWTISVSIEPGYFMAVIELLDNHSQRKPHMKDLTLIVDAMVLT